MSKKNERLAYFSPKKPVPSDSAAGSIPIGRLFYSKEKKLHFETLANGYKSNQEKKTTKNTTTR